MRGDDRKPDALFSYIRPEQRVPADHPLRPIRDMVDTRPRGGGGPGRAHGASRVGVRCSPRPRGEHPEYRDVPAAAALLALATSRAHAAQPRITSQMMLWPKR
jgi:hypothetical protein